MTWRMKIADWISGGELTFQANGWQRSIAIDHERDLAIQKSLAVKAARGAALREIAHMRTPRCASIGNRMADIAEEALK